MNSAQAEGFQRLVAHLKRAIVEELDNRYDTAELETYFDHIELKLELLRLEAKLDNDVNGSTIVELVLSEMAG